jgi:hypothetical protein
MENRSQYHVKPRKAVDHAEQWYAGTPYAVYFQGLSKQTPEDRERKASIKWFDATFPDLALCLQGSLGDMWTPSWKQKSRNKSIGYRPGTHDLFLAVARQGYHGLYFETKGSPKDTLSPDQEIMAAKMREQGYLTAFGTMLSFVRTIQEYVGIVDVNLMKFFNEEIICYS